jgi:hypothetical protein
MCDCAGECQQQFTEADCLIKDIINKREPRYRSQ